MAPQVHPKPVDVCTVSQQTWHDFSTPPLGLAQHTALTHSLFQCIFPAYLYLISCVFYFGEKSWCRQQLLFHGWVTEEVLICN